MDTVLIIEDHKEISDMLAEFLKKQGYEVECVYDGRKALQAFRQKQYKLILMDLMLPYLSGEDLIKELRKEADTPVICISAKSGMDTRIEVLRMGADDYIVKPFNLDEVLVRMEVVLRRGRMNDKEQTANELSCGDLRYMMEEHRVYVGEKELTLTNKEMELLRLFLENPAKTFTKANLYESVWQEEYCYEDNTINVHISNLRSKIKKAAGKDYIDTVWGIGYKLKSE